MSQQTVIAIGESPAVILPPEVLASIGVKIGDTVEVSVVNRHLVVQPLGDARPPSAIDAITDEVFNRRSDAYRRLA